VVLLPELFAGLDEQACAESFRASWQNDDIRILVCSDKPADDQIAAQLVAAYHASTKVAVTAPADATNNAWAYTDFGTPGKVVARKTLEDLDLVQATFANNVRLNIKRTDFKRNSANVGVSFGGGLLEAPTDKPGLVYFTKANFISGGVQKHTLEELNRAVAGKSTSVRFDVDEDTFIIGGSCSSKELETQMQICMAYLTEAAFRQETADNYQKSADSLFSQLEHSLEGMLQRKVQPFFRSGDCRWGTPDREALRSRTVEEARAWLAKPLSSGYMEVTIVGDVDPEQVLELAAKTFGTLPERDAAKPEFKAARVVNFPKTPAVQNFNFTAETLRSMVVVAWPTADAQNFARSCQLSVLSEILGDRIRLKIREELGAAYSPNVYNYESSSLKDFGMIGADMIVDPKQATEIGQLVTTIAADLRDGAISDDEFDRAIKPIMNNIAAAARNNGYWMTVLGLCQSQPKLARRCSANGRGLQEDDKRRHPSPSQSLPVRGTRSDCYLDPGKGR
jgi:zinc protease